MNQSEKSKLKWLTIILAAPFITFAQEAQSTTSTYFSNALFDTLLIVILLLLMLIVALSNVLKNLTQSEYFVNKYKTKNNQSAVGSKIVALLALFSLFGSNLIAQTAETTKAVVANDWRIGEIDGFTFYFLVGIIIIESIAIYMLFTLIKGFIKVDTKEKIVLDSASNKVKVVKEKTILDQLTDIVDIENESEIMLDHDYDGIQELDNNLPPWWKYGFYLTIIVAFIYLTYYHVLGLGDLQGVEYTKSIAEAKIELDEYMKTSANNVDETNVKFLNNPTDLEAGKNIYIEFNCKQCHGQACEGNSVGPNLTDAYWLHSGGIVDIFKTIKYGWTDKGMKSWKEDLSPMQIAQVSSYIKSLGGTNPPNAKAPQGDLYTEPGVKPLSDSTVVKIDSLKVKEVIKDSLTVHK